MSQIFDALHQSANDRAGNASREFPGAKELLQVVELRAGTPAPLVEQQVAAREALRRFPSAKAVLPPHSKFISFTEKESLAAEKFRFLATRLRHLQQKQSLKRLVITSSVTGEGKSMVAANLACALAASNQVLLVEGDFRRPSFGQQLGLLELPGLSQLLQNGADSPHNIYHLEGSGFCFLLAGDVHSNPLEFMEPGKLSTLMDRLSSAFDWIIIDSPPVLPLADTSIWMRLADAILLVTRPGVTTKRQLQRTFEAIEQSKLLGTVLNASTEATSSHYHYYQYAGRSGGLQVSSSAAK